ncbi:MAG: DUF4093 domain-containing protein [Firmicutes bacterium]|nr:DUF4093 domain-containing protein [[Eubacterium] siraeum]MCM1489009.1 DUF4093 domain-containing protein [Bacillota bacterium]
MIKLKQAVIVEGKYDKIKLSSVISSLIITTEGFGIFKDKEKSALIKELAEKQGVIVLTDSDSAGFKIRNYIKNITQKGKIINIYIPDIFGKEKRKQLPSKEGKLGVEGVPKNILIDAFYKAGITAENPLNDVQSHGEEITRIMLYDDGFIGRNGSEERRKKLLKKLSLPEMLSTNGLLEVLNAMFSLDEYKTAVSELDSQ